MHTRRHFFKTVLGLGLGASGIGLAREVRPKLRVGVLASPGAKGFLAALEGAGGGRVEFLRGGLGTTPGSAMREASGLLASKVAVLVVLGDGLEDTLRPLAERYAVPVLLSEVGVLMPRGVSSSPFILKNSLRQWQAEWALGAWSAERRGRTAVVVTGLLEAGYDLPYAFRAGFEAGGGQVLATLVSDGSTGKHDFRAVVAQIRDLNPATVHLVGSSREGLELARYYPNLSVSGFSVGQLPPALTGAFCATTAPAGDGLETLGRWAATWLKAVEEPDSRGLLLALHEAVRTEPIYLSRVQGSVRVKLALLPEPPAYHPALLRLAAHPRSGWTNLYPNV